MSISSLGASSVALPGQLRTADPAAAEGAAAATAFEDLLAAMLGRPGAEEFLRDGETPPKEPIPVREVAEIFNEYGFFSDPALARRLLDQNRLIPEHEHRLRPDGPAAVPLAAAEAPQAVLPPVPSASLGTAMHVVQADRQIAIDQVLFALNKAGVAVHRVPVAAGTTLHAFLRSPQAEESLLEHLSGSRSEATAGEVAPHSFDQLLESGSAAMTQLLVEAGEDEVNLFARVERLSREERARLRSAIEQLLASHGFAAGEIRLEGEQPRVGSAEGDYRHAGNAGSGHAAAFPADTKSRPAP